MRIDFDDDNVFMIETDRDGINAYFDGDPFEQCITGDKDLDTALDEAQGWAGINQRPAYLVIKIDPKVTL